MNETVNAMTKQKFGAVVRLRKIQGESLALQGGDEAD